MLSISVRDHVIHRCISNQLTSWSKKVMRMFDWAFFKSSGLLTE